METEKEKEQEKASLKGGAESLPSAAVAPNTTQLPPPVRVQVGDEAMDFDVVLLGTGSSSDCTALPLVRNLLAEWPVPLVGGFPVLTTDCQWGPDAPVFVVGALAALQLGPGALNLMGARHGADIVATKLGVNNDISQGKINGVYSNVFAALGLSSSDDESLSSSEEEVAPQPRPPPPATKKAAGAGEGKGAKKKKNKGRGARKGSGRN
jgi:hypothetical protein